MVEPVYWINAIWIMPNEPKSCAGCGFDEYLEQGIVIDDVSKGVTYLCTRCEALNIVSDKDPNSCALRAEKGKTVKLRGNPQPKKVQ